ncbi:octopamine receptor beta-2R-like [Tubulanus polymorphus]|uniref:octopamine receptor beta-2R-like n=1 Tax=Tubulanus polymorphus TaxID=672921 RepID=UPI003DA3B520
MEYGRAWNLSSSDRISNQTNLVNSTRSGVGGSDAENEDQSTAIAILKGFAMVAIMVGAAFGNSLVILSVFRFKRLRGITSYFIVSLAFADFLVATCVMPFNASIELTNGRWLFGRIMCDIFNANDVLFSTASILHLCCISMDRYIAITKPLQYEAKMTKRKVIIMLCVTWGASALVSQIPIHSNLYTTSDSIGKMSENPELCIFVVNKIYAGISSTVSFWIPAVIMVFVYVKIFKEAKRQEKQIKAMQRLMVPLRQVPPVRTNSLDSTGNNSNGSYHITTDEGSTDNENTLVLHNRQDRKKMRREHKAAKTLGIIMGAFIACWLPFFLWYFIVAMCGKSCPHSDLLVSVLFWIGYLNSSLNPIIYAFFNREFRNAFRALLGCKRKRRHLYNGYDITGYVNENPNVAHPYQKNNHGKAR